MRARRLTALAILIAFLWLAVLAFLGNRLLAVVFTAVAGAVLAHHAVKLCPRCSNRACAFNPRYGSVEPDGSEGRLEYSELAINRTTVVPLLLAGPLAVFAAWQFSPYWTVAWAVFALSAHSVFRELTCKHCGNRCLGNCNPAYRTRRTTGPASGLKKAHG